MLTYPALHAHTHKQRQTHLRKTRKTGLLVGASEVGLCLRRVWYAKQQRMVLDPKHSEDESWGAARRGTTFENHFWVPAMRKAYGDKLLYTGRQQLTMQHGRLRATPDGLLVLQKRDVLAELGVPDIGASRCVVVECKTIDPRINLSGPKPEHTFQAHIQLGMFHRVTKHQPDYAVISYTNASFFDDVVEFVIKYDDAVYRQGELRAAMIQRATDPIQLRPEGWITGGKECEYCPFVKQCTAIRTGQGMPIADSDKPADPIWLRKITDLAKRERKLAATLGIEEAKQRSMKHEIKELLREAGLRKTSGYGISITWSPVKGRPSWDMKALREAASTLGLDIQKFETVGEPTDRLDIHVSGKPK